MSLTVEQFQSINEKIQNTLKPKHDELLLLERQYSALKQSWNPFKKKRMGEVSELILKLKNSLEAEQKSHMNRLIHELSLKTIEPTQNHIEEVYSSASAALHNYKSNQGPRQLLSEMINCGKITDTRQLLQQLAAEKRWVKEFLEAFPNIGFDAGWTLMFVSMTGARSQLFLSNSQGEVCNDIWKHVFLKNNTKEAIIDAILFRYITSWECTRILPPKPISSLYSLYQKIVDSPWTSVIQNEENFPEIQKTDFEFRITSTESGVYHFSFISFDDNGDHTISEQVGSVHVQGGRPVAWNWSTTEIIRAWGMLINRGGIGYDSREGFW